MTTEQNAHKHIAHVLCDIKIQSYVECLSDSCALLTFHFFYSLEFSVKLATFLWDFSFSYFTISHMNFVLKSDIMLILSKKSTKKVMKLKVSFYKRYGAIQ